MTTGIPLVKCEKYNCKLTVVSCAKRCMTRIIVKGEKTDDSIDPACAQCPVGIQRAKEVGQGVRWVFWSARAQRWIGEEQKARAGFDAYDAAGRVREAPTFRPGVAP